MKRNKLKEKLISGGTVFGGFVFLPEPGLVEILGHAGYDFVLLDLEHSEINLNAIPSMIRAADAVGITPIVRIGEQNSNRVAKALDAGAHGILAPHVKDAEDAKTLVSWTKYPPAGTRSTCTAVRAIQYSAANIPQHVKESNENILFIALIEELSAVDAIDQILDVDGVDIVMPGPADLATSLNVPGGFEHPLVTSAVEKVIKAATNKKKAYAGMYVSTTEQAKRWLDQGAKFIVYSVDSRVIYNAYKEALSKLHSYL